MPLQTVMFGVLLLASLVAVGCSQELRDKIEDEVPGERWFYDDYATARARAEEAGKPLFVVFRCVP